jgi:predicted oxidoreductase
MKTQQIGNTPLETTRIIYGCMNIASGMEDASLADEEKKREARVSVNAALEQGINIFDHADIYGKGKSEEVFSGIWDDHPNLREKVFLQSKCGIRFAGDSGPDAPHRFDFSYAHIINSVNGSLRRLKTDYLDVLLLHRPDPLVEPEEVAKAFDELYRSGKVRFFGVSNHSAVQIQFLKKYLTQPIIVNQMELNLLHSDLINAGVVSNQRQPATMIRGDDTLEYCRLNNITVQAWSPLAKGVLSWHEREQHDPRIRKAASVVNGTAREKGVPPETILVAWLLRHPAGIQPVIGTTNPERIAASCLADYIELSREEWFRLFIAGRGEDIP